MKFNVQFYDAFYPSLEDLTSVEKGAVMSTVAELSARPESPGLKVHRVGDASTECWSARVNDDIRPILIRVQQTVVVGYVIHSGHELVGGGVDFGIPPLYRGQRGLAERPDTYNTPLVL